MTELAWHFLPKDRRTQYDHGKGGRRLIEPGTTLVWRDKLFMCESGLHASTKILDALEYAPGPIICRVECSGEIIRGNDKLVCSRRKVLWMADAERTLHEFACWCAESALKRERKAGREPDKRCWNAIKVKRRWLKGKATDDELTAAAAAYWAAAGAAYWTAAVGSIVGSIPSARAAAAAAYWAAAGDAHEKKLITMVERINRI